MRRAASSGSDGFMARAPRPPAPVVSRGRGTAPPPGPRAPRQAPQRLAVIGVDGHRLPPGRDGCLSLRLVFETLPEQMPRHHIARLQFDDGPEQSGGLLVVAGLLLNYSQIIGRLRHLGR